MTTPLVSVIIAVYNAEPFLSQALDSIFAQTFTDFELIAIDDASTDGSWNTLSGYKDPRLIVLNNAQNIGLTRTLNIGLSLAKGSFIARHDADDISDPNRFRQQIAVFERDPGLGLVGSNHYVIDRQNQLLDTVQYPCSNKELQAFLLEQNCFCHGSVMFRIGCIQKVGGYREQFRVTQDYDLWLRIAECYDLANLPTFLYHFRFHPNTISQSKTDLQLAYERLARVLAEQRRAQGQEGVFPVNVIDAFPPQQQRLLDSALTSAYYLYASGDQAKARSALQNAKAVIEKQDVLFTTWGEWALGHARHLALIRNRVEIGREFIKWVFQNINPSDGNETCRMTLGKFYADQAFLARQGSRDGQVIRNACLAITYHKRWLTNRGLLKITLKSVKSMVLSVFNGWGRVKSEAIAETNHNNDLVTDLRGQGIDLLGGDHAMNSDPNGSAPAGGGRVALSASGVTTGTDKTL